MLIWVAPEAVGLKVPARKYGKWLYVWKNKRIPKHMTEYGDKA